MNPKVSIILTTYNRPVMLRQAIGSVLAQTFQDWELLIVDDHSPLEVQQSVEFFHGDDRIQFYRSTLLPHADCRGMSYLNRFAANINDVFPKSRGEYITYLCDDDLYFPWRLEVMTQALGHSSWDAVFGDQRLLDETPERRCHQIRRGDSLAPAGTVDHSSLMHRREWFEKAGGWDEAAPMRYGDAYFWIRLTAAGCKFHHIPEVLDVHRFHSGSLTWKIDHPEEVATAHEQ